MILLLEIKYKSNSTVNQEFQLKSSDVFIYLVCGVY